MAYSLTENIDYTGNQPNFKRDKVSRISVLKSASDEDYDIGHIVYCSENKKHYKYMGSSETLDENTGYFRELIEKEEIEFDVLSSQDLDNILK